ncbi:SDR family NAD(P)-dependent oxidoreductase [Paenibacillus harenae]|uniref:Acyl transferase domain-containing protein/acyl carrier protein n=1 Tax=Paenibacillus harenae TaxID=306543 RepID=A0ABT9U7M0_PAEHA|nr:SDR family NAD(P)-dependent oxidoreductase [Paenibacillus harenae]MDQ0115563.1 acyl transferase domain-containing protein/acyl carrier protein [Paenibacillus harenae]
MGKGTETINGKANHYKFSLMMENDNYIVRDHHVHDVRMVPGVTWMDTILRGLESKGFPLARLELRNVLFLTPVDTSSGHDRSVQFTITKSRNHWKIEAKSQRVKNGKALAPEWDLNLTAELYVREEEMSKTIDLQAMMQGSRRQSDLEDAYAFMRRVEINHYEFMKARGTLYETTDGVLAEIHLSGLAETVAPSFMLHPVFLDCSTIIQANLLTRTMKLNEVADSELKPYIPICIESFRPAGRLYDRCYVFVPQASNITSASGDVIYSDVELYDEDGRLAAVMHRFTTKRIRSRDLIRNLHGKNEETDTAAVLAPEQIETPAVPAAQVKPDSGASDAFNASNKSDSSEELLPLIEKDLCMMIGEMLGKPPREVDKEAGFYDQGLDSGNLLKLVQDLEAKLAIQLYPTLLFEYTNVNALAAFLALEHAAAYRGRGNEPVQSSELNSDIDTVYFQHGWKRAEFANMQAVEGLRGPVLLVDKDEQLFSALRSKLEGVRVLLVQPGEGYRDLGGGKYEIDPASPEQYHQLVTQLKRSNVLPVNILHRWADEAFSANEEAMTAYHMNGLQSLLHLTQALLEHKPKEKTRLLYVYTAKDGTEPQHMAAGGFALTLHRENPRLFYKTVELRGGSAAGPQLAELATAEWLTEDAAEIRYESGRRYSKQLVERKAVQAAEAAVPLKHGGVYLITGGAGSLGLLFATYIAERVKAKLILTGRSPLGEDKAVQLNKLEALGAEVLYIAADISKTEDAERLVREAKWKFGRIDGVIHSAGITRDSLIVEKTAADMEAVLSPKVQGTVLLDEALRAEAIDYFVCFSSIAALGNAGQADYAYANAFLDAYMIRRNELKEQGERAGRSISINWPLWKEGGMQLDDSTAAFMFEQMGISAMRTSSGLLAFEQSFLLGDTGLVVVEGDRERLVKGLTAPSAKPTMASSTSSTAPKMSAASPSPSSSASKEKPAYEEDDIAIVGLSGRYPQAANLREFWQNLRSGRNSVTEIPVERWDYREDYSEDRSKAGSTYAKWGGFIDDADKFDPLFFNISPLEAEYMDPQERLFLQAVWETVEDAGTTRKGLGTNKVGVFVGVMWSQYQLLGAEEALRGNKLALGANISSIANRVNYVFNFQGPSIALDTMCSSSITSIHYACESIRRGDCELAIAGGVNLSIHPNKYLLLSQAKFASGEGLCRAFGEGGDGYVPGEGVGAVLLKPLKKAIADQDQIYAVIKGSAINHGGKSGGYYVPTPTAQGEVIANAMRKAGVDPSTITYLEAHGTGTSLGDPIEINGLTKAFGSSTEKQHCAIGSVKTNIGHLESAAGIAGLTKILLQMKHGELVPSLHAETLNKKIDFARSPFRVQRKLEKWENPVGRDENGFMTQLPKRAGISAFGAGGANAHLILEQFMSAPRPRPAQTIPQIVILSARNEERLRAYASSMHDFAASLRQSGEEAAIEDIAYTSQVGREAMEERLAIIASSIQELQEKLLIYVQAQGSKELPGVFTGNTRRNSGALALLLDGREFNPYLEVVLQDKKLSKLAQLWINGVDIDWNLLHDLACVRKISLPTYPFARERYWVPNFIGGSIAHRHGEPSKLHPMLGHNISTLKEQKFSTRFTGEEFFLRDHIVNGRKLLPGVAYLEMALAAGEMAAEESVRRLKNVAWTLPVYADEQVDVQMLLEPSPFDDDVAFQAFTMNAAGERSIHASGTLAFDPCVPEAIDLPSIRERCRDMQSQADIYTSFRDYGFAYGAGMQAIAELRSSESEALSKLVLPKEHKADFQAYGLHPALMDGALQTVAAIIGNREPGMAYLPFSISEVECMASLEEVLYVHAARIGSNKKEAPMLHFQVELLDQSGKVLVKLRDFTLKAFRQEEKSEADRLMELLQMVENGSFRLEEAEKRIGELI